MGSNHRQVCVGNYQKDTKNTQVKKGNNADEKMFASASHSMNFICFKNQKKKLSYN